MATDEVGAERQRHAGLVPRATPAPPFSQGKAAGGGPPHQTRTSEPESVVGAGRPPRAEQRRPPRARNKPQRQGEIGFCFRRWENAVVELSGIEPLTSSLRIANELSTPLI